MVNDRHYPPAYYKYKEEHPVISVVLSKDLKQLLDLQRKNKKQSYAQLIKEFIMKGCDLLKVRQECNEAWEKKYKASRHFEMGSCHNCGKALNWNLDNPRDMELLTHSVNKAGYIHHNCG